METLRRIASALSDIVIDLDGVVYKGTKLIDGADAAIKMFRQNGKRVHFLTNSSAKGRVAVAERLCSLGVDCFAREVMTSATASAIYLQSVGYRNIFVIGEESLRNEIREYRIEVTDNPGKADALLVGLDSQFSYQKLADAMICLSNGCKFVICNRDASYPVDNGQRLPGCGPIVAAVEVASGRNADVDIGKPNKFMLDALLGDNYCSRNIAIVGDGLTSDMALAARIGSAGIYIDDSAKCACRHDDFFMFRSLYEFSAWLCRAL
ncbi:MAG: HAD-IIA family hydrolase [Deltaproteobacteria bacterium]|nr:HAD-IIA family hydrolase [Deltaproteobacteria bacterium]